MENPNYELLVFPTSVDCFLLVLAFLNNTGIIERFLSAISFELNMSEHALKINLGPSVPIEPQEIAPIQPEDRKEFTTTKFIDLLEQYKINTVDIISNGFDYRNWPEFSFILILLLQLTSITQLQLTIEDCKPAFNDELNVLLSAALHSPQNLLQLTLNYSDHELSLKAQEELQNILQTTVFEAGRLGKFELKAYGKNFSLAKIMEGAIYEGTGLALSLRELILEGEDFSNKAVLAGIFGYLENAETLKIKVINIDVDDETLLELTGNLRIAESLKSLHLCLRNPQVGNPGIEKLLKMKFRQLEDAKIDLAGSGVNDEGFDVWTHERCDNFKDVEQFPFHLENTDVTKEQADLLIYVHELKKTGQTLDDESSDKTVVDSLKHS